MRRTHRGSHWIVAALSVALVLTGAWPAAAATTAYRDQAFTPLPNYPGSSGNRQSPTADKPQSKLWYAGGSWWALMIGGSPQSVRIHKLGADHVFTDTGVVVDTRAASTGDALFSNGFLYVVSRAYAAGSPTYYSRFELVSGVWTRRVGPISIGSPAVESATIARADNGTLWVTYTSSSRVRVTHSLGLDDLHWTGGFTPTGATNVQSDDISSVVAMRGAVGVFWSDHAASAFYFAVHRDGDADSAWTLETAASGSLIADDHMVVRTLLADDSSRIYAAVKTSLNDTSSPSTDPLMLLLTRTATGVWRRSTIATIADDVTRPTLALDQSARLVRVFYTADPKGSSTIRTKSAAFGDQPTFQPGVGRTVIGWPGAQINDATTTKQPVTTASGLVVLASDAEHGRYYHSEGLPS